MKNLKMLKIWEYGFPKMNFNNHIIKTSLKGMRMLEFILWNYSEWSPQYKILSNRIARVQNKKFMFMLQRNLQILNFLSNYVAFFNGIQSSKKSRVHIMNKNVIWFTPDFVSYLYIS